MTQSVDTPGYVGAQETPTGRLRWVNASPDLSPGAGPAFLEQEWEVIQLGDRPSLRFEWRPVPIVRRDECGTPS